MDDAVSEVGFGVEGEFGFDGVGDEDGRLPSCSGGDGIDVLDSRENGLDGDVGEDGIDLVGHRCEDGFGCADNEDGVIAVDVKQCGFKVFDVGDVRWISSVITLIKRRGLRIPMAMTVIQLRSELPE